MEKFNNLVFDRLKKHKIAPAALAAMVIDSANQKIKNELKAEPEEVKATQLKDACLIIGSSSSVWSQELWGFNESLISSLQEKYGEQVISKIRIKSLTTD